MQVKVCVSVCVSGRGMGVGEGGNLLDCTCMWLTSVLMCTARK